MAKVTMPFQGTSASGKFGNSMVHFTWKGISVVREWLKPANPKTASQGNRRTMLGGTGRAVGEIVVSSAFHQQLITLKLIPGGQTKQSYIVDYIMSHYLTDITAFGTELAALTGHTYYAVWGTSADSLGLVEFSLAYDSIAAYNKALGLYLMAKTAIALGFTGTPYTTALASWVTADITGYAADLTGA